MRLERRRKPGVVGGPKAAATKPATPSKDDCFFVQPMGSTSPVGVPPSDVRSQREAQGGDGASASSDHGCGQRAKPEGGVCGVRRQLLRSAEPVEGDFAAGSTSEQAGLFSGCAVAEAHASVEHGVLEGSLKNTRKKKSVRLS